jgi:2,3-bisphosphoglycerate-independent phosphoglycerate mutase
MDQIAADGTLGRVDTIPEGMSPGSDVATLSVLGYDPRENYTGRGPLEAASMGISLGPNDMVYRCNLVTIGDKDSPNAFMDDFTSGHISSEEAREIILDLNKKLGSPQLEFFPGVGYRHLFVRRESPDAPQTTPPHDITGKPIAEYLPRGNSFEEIHSIMQRAGEVLLNHPVNARRKEAGKKQANSIWLWGQGRKPQIVRLTEKYSITGGMISAVDLLKGIGILAGLKVCPVEGATGYIDTNYAGKAEMALDVLKFMDFVFVHLEAPDEMGHEGNAEGKIRAIELFDEKIVGPVLNKMKSFGDYRIIVLSDHPTPLSVRTHVSDPSPFAVFSSVKGENRAAGLAFTEANAKESGILISPGHLLMEKFITDWRKVAGS